MEKILGVLGIFALLFVGGAVLFFTLTPVGHEIIGSYNSSIEKADTNSSFDTKKQVEDTARSMIASYKSDEATYNQYKNSSDKEKTNWGEEAKMRANKTAASYNEFLIKNSFVWKDNIPEDIYMNLAMIQ